MITRVSEHLSVWFSSSFGKESVSTDHLLTAGRKYKWGEGVRRSPTSRRWFQKTEDA